MLLDLTCCELEVGELAPLPVLTHLCETGLCRRLVAGGSERLGKRHLVSVVAVRDDSGDVGDSQDVELVDQHSELAVGT